MKKEKREQLIVKLTSLINSLSIENESDTPDYILAEYLLDCLNSFKRVTKRRDKWWGHRNIKC